MASVKKKYNRSGKPCYEIRCHIGKGLPTYTRRWYYNETWSEKVIQKELAKAVVQFEEDCRAGKVLSKTQKIEQDALDAAEQAKIQTFSQYSSKIFMPAIRARCTPNTIASYQGTLNTWILPAFGDVKLPEITSSMITALLTDMQVQGKSHGTVIKVYTILSSFFKMAEMNDAVSVNPMHKVQRPKEPKEQKKDGVESYSADEVLEILSALEQEPLQWQVYVQILVQTGIRRGEACGLKWSDFDFKEGTISIQRSLNYTPERGVYENKTKSGHTRTVYIDSDVVALVKKYRESQKISSVYVFTQEDGKPMFPDSPTRYFKKFSERYGIPHFHPHILRHTFASLAITNGADVESISEILGHADAGTTLRLYTSGNDESRRKASALVHSIINGG